LKSRSDGTVYLDVFDPRFADQRSGILTTHTQDHRFINGQDSYLLQRRRLNRAKTRLALRRVYFTLEANDKSVFISERGARNAQGAA